jgi:hypothetical protein
MSKNRTKLVHQHRREIKRGGRARFAVVLEKREVLALPWLEFGGARPDEVAEAARRAIASELGVRADQVEVEPT